jgi:cytochrome P450
MAVDISTFNPFDPSTQQCPFPHYAQMREEAPVHPVPGLGVHLVTKHDLVMQVLRDPQTYSSMFGGAGMPLSSADREKFAEVMAAGYPRVPTMLTADQPDHTRYRRLVARAFHPKVIAEMEPIIRQITVELIESWIDKGRIEFVKEFGVPLPVRVIAKALNVPDDRLADFKRWSDDSIAGIGTNITLEQRLQAEYGVNEFQHYFAEQIELRRTNPQDDILTNLLNASIDDDDPEVTDKRQLDMPEMLSIIQQLLVAGNETTTKSLTEMVRLLAENPEEWAALKADPSRAEKVFEETLRLSTPTQGMWRILTKDAELGGVQLTKGQRIIIVFASANRDEALYNNPDDFIPMRDHLRDNLAFGKGIHFCLGANLSRLEGKVAAEELSKRIETITLSESNKYQYFPSFMLRGLTDLDIEFTAAKGVTA